MRTPPAKNRRNAGTFKKGQSGNPRGRKPGVPNKSTVLAREAIATFVDANAERLQGWLDAIAIAEGPKAAFACFTDLLEYHVPKLARTEVTGGEGVPLIPAGGITFVIHEQPGAVNKS